MSKFKKARVTKVAKTASKKFSTYVSTSMLPFYSSSSLWHYNENGILQDSLIKSSYKRRVYGKDQFITLKRQYREGIEKETLTKAISALKYSPLNADPQQETELLEFLGAFCDENNLFKEAEHFYTSALINRMLEPELFGYGESALKLADVLNKQKQYEDAIKFASFALTEFSNAGDREGIARCNLSIADTYLNRGDLLVAEKIILNKSLGLFSYVGNQVGRMACFERLGQIYIKLNRNSEAKWFFIQQNMLSKTLGNKVEQFRSLVDLGRTKTAIGDYHLALKDFREANTMLGGINSVESQLKLEEAYSGLFQKQGNKKLAKLSMQKCKKLKSALGKDQTSQKKAAYRLLNYSKEQKQVYFANTISSDIKRHD